jgi:ketosteroid isomerase-like protein
MSVRSSIRCLPFVVAGFSSGCATRSDPRLEPLVVLHRQEDAWNRGDIDGFMDGYHRSADTTFSGSDGTIRGFDAVLERYRKRYPDRAAMGKVAFSDLHVTPLGDSAALVTGAWKLTRERDTLGGVFSLVFLRFGDGWKVVHDHTSAFSPRPPPVGAPDTPVGSPGSPR